MGEVLTTAEIFERLQQPTVKLGVERAAEKLPLGASKFGGNPSAPRDFAWPFYRGKSDDGARRGWTGGGRKSNLPEPRPLK